MHRMNKHQCRKIPDVIHPVCLACQDLIYMFIHGCDERFGDGCFSRLVFLRKYWHNVNDNKDTPILHVPHFNKLERLPFSGKCINGKFPVMRLSFYYLGIPLLALCACSNMKESDLVKAMASTADSTAFAQDISTSLNSGSRKRIKSADVRCRVSNVFAATSSIEQLVNRLDGVVVESNLQNESVAHYSLPYSADSIKSVQLYTPVATLTLRVPEDKLDSVVYSLTAMAAFIDHRIKKNEDATMKYLANALRNEQREKSAANEKVVPAKNGTAVDVAEYKDNQDAAVVNRRVENLSILDQAAYSTFTVQLFQPQVADVQILFNPDRASRAGFGTELATSLRTGAEVLRNILLFFVSIWPFVIAGIVGWVGYRKLRVKH